MLQMNGVILSKAVCEDEGTKSGGICVTEMEPLFTADCGHSILIVQLTVLEQRDSPLNSSSRGSFQIKLQ